MPGAFAQMGHALNGGCAGTDDPDPLALQTRQATHGITACIVIVPAAGMEGVALEGLNPGNAWQLGPVQRAIGHDHEPGLHGIAAVGPDDPA